MTVLLAFEDFLRRSQSGNRSGFDFVKNFFLFRKKHPNIDASISSVKGFYPFAEGFVSQVKSCQPSKSEFLQISECLPVLVGANKLLEQPVQVGTLNALHEMSSSETALVLNRILACNIPLRNFKYTISAIQHKLLNSKWDKDTVIEMTKVQLSNPTYSEFFSVFNTRITETLDQLSFSDLCEVAQNPIGKEHRKYVIKCIFDFFNSPLSSETLYRSMALAYPIRELRESLSPKIEAELLRQEVRIPLDLLRLLEFVSSKVVLTAIKPKVKSQIRVSVSDPHVLAAVYLSYARISDLEIPKMIDSVLRAQLNQLPESQITQLKQYLSSS
jgi:hypothetical protein